MQWLMVALQLELLQHLFTVEVACRLQHGAPFLRPRHTVLLLRQAKYESYGIALHHSLLGPHLMRLSVPFLVTVFETYPKQGVLFTPSWPIGGVGAMVPQPGKCPFPGGQQLSGAVVGPFVS